MEKTNSLPVTKQEHCESESAVDWSPGEESSLRMKLDLRIMPMVFILFLLCYIDRSVKIVRWYIESH